MYKIEDIINKVHQSDCLEFMKEMEENSVDTIITDPPYGLEFMGKEWDKLGATLDETKKDGKDDMFFSGKRIRYGKSVKSMQGWHYNWAVEALRVAKPGATLLCFGGTRTWHRMACAIEDAGWEIRDTIAWMYGSGFPKSLNIGKAIDKKAGKERKVIGRNPNSRENCDKSNTLYESGTVGKTDIITKGNSEWEGYGTSLKPAFEPIILAMKKNDGTYANNALKHGVAGLNIDGGRIGYQSEKDKKEGQSSRKSKTSNKNDYTFHKGGLEGMDRSDRSEVKGRFPANVILDEEAGKMLDEQSGVLKSGDLLPGHKRGDGTGNSFMGGGGIIKGKYGGDKGGASRFFYCAKSSKAERNAGLEGFEKKIDCDRNPKLDSANVPMNRSNNPKVNSHPTIKPLSLMRYLCNLTKTPTGGIILDPFAGSGSTLIAAKQVGRDYIGIEKDEEYCKIAEARIKAVPDKLI